MRLSALFALALPLAACGSTTTETAAPAEASSPAPAEGAPEAGAETEGDAPAATEGDAGAQTEGDAAPAADGDAAPAADGDAAPAEDHAGHDHAAAATSEFVKAPKDASISFGTPSDGETVKSPVHVQMQVNNMEVVAPGRSIPGTGHHHILIDAEGTPEGEVVPKDAQHIHYGDGSLEADLELTPGEHTLTLQFADGMHRSYGPALSSSVTITVK
jgi:hypothetical protein